MSQKKELDRISDVVKRTFVIAYKEDVQILESTLIAEQLNPSVIRASYTTEEMTYSRATRCLMNHSNAWKLAANLEGYSLICESDFVPCKKMGELPVFWPLEKSNAWGYLYQGSPRLLSVVGDEYYIRMHGSTTVAYVVNEEIARILLRFFEDTTSKNDLKSYWPWDCYMQWSAMGYGAEAYMPTRNYGEHGGLPNAEHGLNGMSNSGIHRADVLARSLAFMPAYAHNSWWLLIKERYIYWFKGWLRLFSGRWLILVKEYPVTPLRLIKIYWIGIMRLFTIPTT